MKRAVVFVQALCLLSSCRAPSPDGNGNGVGAREGAGDERRQVLTASGDLPPSPNTFMNEEQCRQSVPDGARCEVEGASCAGGRSDCAGGGTMADGRPIPPRCGGTQWHCACGPSATGPRWACRTVMHAAGPLPPPELDEA